jgi:hypothetical protein
MTALTRASSNLNYRPSPLQKVCYIRAITAGVELENKINGREFQGACRQDELIGGTPAVVNQLLSSFLPGN